MEDKLIHKVQPHTEMLNILLKTPENFVFP